MSDIILSNEEYTSLVKSCIETGRAGAYEEVERGIRICSERGIDALVHIKGLIELEKKYNKEWKGEEK